MAKNLLTVFLLLISLNVLSQDTTDAFRYRSRFTEERALLLGFNTGPYTYAEIGYAFNRYGNAGPHPIASAWYSGSEIMIGRDLIIGPKIGVHMLGGLGLGGCMIYYTNFDEGSLVLRPEFGMGIERVRMAYGYNFKITNTDFERVNRHMFTFAYLITLKKKE